ncbi:MAG: aminopeptidase, partial [Clostridiales bacterium]|nr:aminopeptidase [Clostridiales bacterium]
MGDKAWRVMDAEFTAERYNLMTYRLGRIADEQLVPVKFQDYFEKGAAILLKAAEIYEKKAAGALDGRSLEECRADQEAIWGHLAAGRYESSYANPDYAVGCFGGEAGHMLTFLASEVEGCASYAFRGQQEELTLFMELFVQVYNCFEEEDLKEARETIYWFFHDYSEIFGEDQIHDMICPDDNFFIDIVMNADLDDLRYLYNYGLPIGENEIRVAEFLGSLPEKEIQAMADTYTEGYRLGFVQAGIDLSQKGVAEVDFPVGFERIMRIAVGNFAGMGLKCTAAREPSTSFLGKGKMKRGVYSTSINRQYDFDHREDMAFYFDKAFVERRLEVMRTVFEQHKEAAGEYAGPAVTEVFGESSFSPEVKEAAIRYDEEQQKLNVYYSSEAGLITYSYIHGDERSFTIIAWPMPEIGEDFEEIFAETVKINTLDYEKYQKIQQCLIDELDRAERVHIQGKGLNRTDLNVTIRHLDDPATESAFENCVADVNIPVGEVFTSPVLAGTNGTLHVSEVFLNGLCFKNLELKFINGMIESYTCTNFENEEDNLKYIRDNVLMHHETLPMGEFAIGTNTTAYVMAGKYHIEDR